MTEGDSGLTHTEAIETRIDALIRECRRNKRRILRENDLPKLPKELEQCIYEILLLEDMVRAMLRGPVNVNPK